MQRFSNFVQIRGRQQFIQRKILHQLIVSEDKFHTFLQASISNETDSSMETLGMLQDIECQSYSVLG